MRKRIFALAAVAAMALSATACNLNIGEVTEDQKAIHAQYTKGYMLEVEEDGQMVTHFYACDDENTVASYGFYSGQEEDGASVDMSISVTGPVEMNEDGTFVIAQEDAFFESVYQAVFMEDGTLNLYLDGDGPLEMAPADVAEVVTLMQETAGFHLNAEVE